MRGWKKVFRVNGYQLKAGKSIFIAEKIDFTVTRDKKGHYIITKNSIHQEDKVKCLCTKQHRGKICEDKS